MYDKVKSIGRLDVWPDLNKHNFLFCYIVWQCGDDPPPADIFRLLPVRDALKRRFSTPNFFFGECPSNDVTHVGRKRAFGVVAEEEEETLPSTKRATIVKTT